MAARRDHDANIGRRSFHLFRLPAYMENQLVDLMRTEAAFADSDIPDTPEQIIEVLESLAPQETTLTGTGPSLVGSIPMLASCIRTSECGRWNRDCMTACRCRP